MSYLFETNNFHHEGSLATGTRGRFTLSPPLNPALHALYECRNSRKIRFRTSHRKVMNRSRSTFRLISSEVSHMLFKIKKKLCGNGNVPKGPSTILMCGQTTMQNQMTSNDLQILMDFHAEANSKT